MTKMSRRDFLVRSAALSATAALLPTKFAVGQTAKVRVGLMLPYSGTYAALGEAITDGFMLAINERGGKLGGREVEYIKLDDESNPGKGPENANKLITGERIDFLVGTVHSGVAMGMVKVASNSNSILVIPNAGVGAATGPLCAPNIFRTSFSNWQPAYPMGQVAWDRGMRKIVTISWKYGAGEEQLGGFEENFTRLGGQIVKRIMLPFPNQEFQANLTEIAALKPDGVFAFFAGAGALKFVKDYAAAGLKSIPLMGTGFLTEGVLAGQGAAAEGVLTTLHYADDLDNSQNIHFRDAYKNLTGKNADVYAVQGYDSGQLISIGMDKVHGDTSNGSRAELIAAMENAQINSPRGSFTFSPAHNPVQDIYLREVKNGQQVVLGIAHKALSDPAKGCNV